MQSSSDITLVTFDPRAYLRALLRTYYSHQNVVDDELVYRSRVVRLENGRASTPFSAKAYIGHGTYSFTIADDRHVYKLSLRDAYSPHSLRHDTAREALVGLFLARHPNRALREYAVGTEALVFWRPTRPEADAWLDAARRPSNVSDVQLTQVLRSPRYDRARPRLPELDVTDVLEERTARAIRRTLGGAESPLSGYVKWLTDTAHGSNIPRFVGYSVQRQPRVIGHTLQTLLRRDGADSWLTDEHAADLSAFLAMLMHMLALMRAETGFVHMDLSTANVMAARLADPSELPFAYQQLSFVGPGREHRFAPPRSGYVPRLIDLARASFRRDSMSAVLGELVGRELPTDRIAEPTFPAVSGSEDVRRLGMYILHGVFARLMEEHARAKKEARAPTLWQLVDRIGGKVLQLGARMGTLGAPWDKHMWDELLPDARAAAFEYRCATFTDFMQAHLRIRRFCTALVKAKKGLLGGMPPDAPSVRLVLSAHAAERAARDSVSVLNDINPYMRRAMIQFGELKAHEELHYTPARVREWDLLRLAPAANADSDSE